MSKVIAASEQGRLFVFPALLEASFDEDRLADEQVETKHIVIVAHEVIPQHNFQFTVTIIALGICYIDSKVAFFK
jgi:hypothetical protein